jgi:hypothetical protein
MAINSGGAKIVLSVCCTWSPELHQQTLQTTTQWIQFSGLVAHRYTSIYRSDLVPLSDNFLLVLLPIVMTKYMYVG